MVSTSVGEKERKTARRKLHVWGSSFSRSSHGRSYLDNDEIRWELFPSAPTSAVYYPSEVLPQSEVEPEDHGSAHAGEDPLPFAISG